MSLAADEQGVLATSTSGYRTEGVSDYRDDGVRPLLTQYWAAIRRRKYVILMIVLAAAVIGIVATLMMPSTYTATSQLEIKREQNQVTNVEGVEARTSAQDQEFYATQYVLLETRPVVERVARDLRLARNDDFFLSHGVDLEAVDTLSTATGRNNRLELAVDLLLDNVTIEPIRTSRLVDIRYESRDPDLAARVANEWAEAFIAVSMDRQFASTADAREFLEERLATLRERLEESERAAVNFAANQGIVSLEQTRDGEGRTIGNRTLVGSNLDALNEELIRATADRVEAEAALGGLGGSSPQALSSATLSSLRQQREAAAAEAARLSTQFEPEYPQLRALNQQVASLDRAIAAETGRINDGRRLAYRQAAEREQNLRSRVNELQDQLVSQNRASIQYNIYQRDADTNRQLYDALLQRYKEIGVVGTVGISNISIVQAAETPTSPSSPNLLLNLVLAMFGGLVIAVAATVALEQIDEGIRMPDEVPNRLGLPLLGIAPQIEGDVREEIFDSKSELYEAYFSARSNLAFATPHGFPKSLAVTSTRPAEGKSSSALALAYILGRLGQRVLLIDGDMRSPTVHDAMGTANQSGLSNFLAGDEDWQGMIRQSETSNVHFMTAGPVPPNAAELLSGQRITDLINTLSTEFDHIIVDSPPVLSLSDAPMIARAVEGSLLVVESGGVALRAVRNSVRRIRQVHGNIFGVMLTKADIHATGYGYGYGYGLRYGSEEHEQAET